LRDFCRKTDDVKEHIHNLQSIPGIGIVTSSALLGRSVIPFLTKSPGTRFFLRPCRPRKIHGNKVRRGSITHTGNAHLRSLLVEAAWRTIQRDTELKQFYDRIASRHHILFAKQKAIVAVARK